VGTSLWKDTSAMEFPRRSDLCFSGDEAKLWDRPYLIVLKNHSRNSAIRIQRRLTHKIKPILPCLKIHISDEILRKIRKTANRYTKKVKHDLLGGCKKVMAEVKNKKQKL